MAGSGGSRQGGLGLRLINASKTIDRWYGRLDRLRSTVILALASEAALDRYNEQAYSRADRYNPDSGAYVGELYPWEQKAIAQHFPPPPARLLVGGAGAGRESLALATQGYRVLAFEPVLSLARAMDRQARERGLGGVEAYLGCYSDLPQVWPVNATPAPPLTDRPRFEAAIIGWGSFSHLRTEAARLAALTNMAALTSGPILISFISVRPDGEVSSGRIRRWLLPRRSRHPADRFSMSMGYLHPISQQEILELADRAALEVVRVDFSPDVLAPHAVLWSR